MLCHGLKVPLKLRLGHLKMEPLGSICLLFPVVPESQTGLAWQIMDRTLPYSVWRAPDIWWKLLLSPCSASEQCSISDSTALPTLWSPSSPALLSLLEQSHGCCSLATLLRAKAWSQPKVLSQRAEGACVRGPSETCKANQVCWDTQHPHRKQDHIPDLQTTLRTIKLH